MRPAVRGFTQHVKKIATSTSTASSSNPSTYGQTVIFIAIVTSSSGTPPDGEIVTFYKNDFVLGTGALSGGATTYSTSSLATGSYNITARYSGDPTFAASTSRILKQVVNAAALSLQRPIL